MTSQNFWQGFRVLGFAAALAGYATSAGAQISDTTPPQLVAISFAPASVDVTNGAKVVTVTATITDNLSGTSLSRTNGAPPFVQFVSPSGTQRRPFDSVFGPTLTRISGTPLNGVYQVSISIPQFSEAGAWNIGSVRFNDVAGNSLSLTTANLIALGFPTTLTVVSVPDSHPPSVSKVTFSAPVIDVSAGPQNLTLGLSLIDDVSGIDFSPTRFLEFRVTFVSPSGHQQQYLSRPDFTLTSGGPLDSAWQATRVFPRYSEDGVWRIGTIRLIDVAGNVATLTTANLVALGLPTTFNVVSVPSDITPPDVTALTFAPSVIDTSTGSRTVAVTLTITDDLAGTDFLADAAGATVLHTIQFRSPSGQQLNMSGTCCLFRLTAGTPLNGTWTANVVFPQFSEGGTWTASLVGIQDITHNIVTLNTAALASKGFPTELVIFEPSLATDGSLPATGGTVTDSVFGERAALTFPPGLLPGPTDVAIDVLSSSLGLPTPAGFSGGTLFMNIALKPTPPMPFSVPGLTLTLPIANFKAPGSLVNLYRLDSGTGLLVPAISVSGLNVVGTVNADGLSSTFTGVSRLSTLVGFYSTAVVGDVNSDGVVTCADVAIVKLSFGKRVGQFAFDARADVNRNGVVDINDLTLVSRQLPVGTVCR